MAKNRDNVRIFGDLESEVYVAPLGSTLPTDLVDPDVAFESLGWLSEDGIEVEIATDSEKFKAWQGGTTLRTKITSTEKTIKFQAVESNPLVTGLFYDHGAPVVASGVARVDLPEGIRTVARAAVFKFVDGDVTEYLCCERIEITDRGAVPHKNDEMTMYEFTAEILGDSFMLTNAPAYLE